MSTKTLKQGFGMTRFYPPYYYLEQVLEHCPQAGALYLKIWRDKDKETYKVNYSKKQVVHDDAISWRKFKCDLRYLFRLGVCEYSFGADDLEVTITVSEEPDDFTANLFLHKRGG